MTTDLPPNDAPSVPTTPALLELQDIGKTFRSDLFKPAHTAVDKLNLVLHPGSVTGLLGPNGAGKTTTIRIILGLVKADHGRILFRGQAMRTGARRSIGYMPEVSKLPGALNAYEVLKQQLLLTRSMPKSRRQGQQLLEDKIQAVGLGKHGKKPIRLLSKGLARRVAWAQATIHNPDLLILDEPASGLDPLARDLMLRWISEEQQRGAGILLCTHELAQVRALCQEIIILNQGRVAFDSRKVAADASLWRAQPFQVHVAGDGEASLLQLAKTQGLPPWNSLEQRGFLAVLGFAGQTPANLWLNALVRGDRVVTYFGEAGASSQSQALLQYFAEARR